MKAFFSFVAMGWIGLSVSASAGPANTLPTEHELTSLLTRAVAKTIVIYDDVRVSASAGERLQLGRERFIRGGVLFSDLAQMFDRFAKVQEWVSLEKILRQFALTQLRTLEETQAYFVLVRGFVSSMPKDLAHAHYDAVAQQGVLGFSSPEKIVDFYAEALKNSRRKFEFLLHAVQGWEYWNRILQHAVNTPDKLDRVAKALQQPLAQPAVKAASQHGLWRLYYDLFEQLDESVLKSAEFKALIPELNNAVFDSMLRETELRGRPMSGDAFTLARHLFVPSSKPESDGLLFEAQKLILENSSIRERVEKALSEDGMLDDDCRSSLEAVL